MKLEIFFLPSLSFSNLPETPGQAAIMITVQLDKRLATLPIRTHDTPNLPRDTPISSACPGRTDVHSVLLGKNIRPAKVEMLT